MVDTNEASSGSMITDNSSSSNGRRGEYVVEEVEVEPYNNISEFHVSNVQMSGLKLQSEKSEIPENPRTILLSSRNTDSRWYSRRVDVTIGNGHHTSTNTIAAVHGRQRHRVQSSHHFQNRCRDSWY